MTLRRRILVRVASVATVVALLALWERVDVGTAIYLSRPSDVATAIGEWLSVPELRATIPQTLQEAGLGFLYAVMVAVVLAVLLGASRTVADFVMPFVAVFNAVPKVALAPLFLLIFGIGATANTVFVATVVFFLPFYSLFVALTTMDETILNNTRALGAGRLWLVRDVYLPSVLASMASSIRVAATYALLAAVVAELIGSQTGMGAQIQTAQAGLQADFVLAGVVIVAVLAFAFDRFLILIERHLAGWRLA